MLNSVLTRSCVEIPILNDIVPENDEDFTVRLTVDDDRAVIATEVATVTISDDDGKLVYKLMPNADDGKFISWYLNVCPA